MTKNFLIHLMQPFRNFGIKYNMSESMNTAQLVKRCQAGDRDAFGQLYSLYAPNMLKVIEAIVHNNDTAQDVLQDGFIIAYSSIASLNKSERFESWLTTIMRNLSLQLLRDEANHISVPMSDTSFNDLSENDAADGYISWDVLSKIIYKLPEGYGEVFRLAVLDGLSHKEIGEMLGIAPHSSSSQLHHAKAMLRKLITEYRTGIDIFSLVIVVLTILYVWLGIDRHPSADPKNLITKETDKDNNHIPSTQEIVEKLSEDTIPQTSILKQIIEATQPEAKDNITSVILPDDSTAIVLPKDSVDTYTVLNLRKHIFDNSGLLADNNISKQSHRDGWSISMSYTGDMGQNESNRYMIPSDIHPDLPSEDPDMIEVREQSRNYMPVVIGLSLNKSLSSRWSLETGMRYSFLRSDFLLESEIKTSETIQRIHYIGIPLKFNYRIFGNPHFSLYGQGGAALDIPVRATQSVTKFEQGWNKPMTESLNVSAPMQWSVEGGLGLQYHFTPSFSIYAEPSLRYYFNPGTEIRTIRQDKPFEFTIPIGLRLTW